jgi:hypothetical protein
MLGIMHKSKLAIITKIIYLFVYMRLNSFNFNILNLNLQQLMNNLKNAHHIVVFVIMSQLVETTINNNLILSFDKAFMTLHTRLNLSHLLVLGLSHYICS